MTLYTYFLVVGPMIVENIYRSAPMVEKIYRLAFSQGRDDGLP